MANHIQGTHEGSLVHRFITSGKPGDCEFCKKTVDKLEAHHIKYSPEVTIKLCHDCHHKIHFWPNRLSQPEKYKCFKKLYSESQALELSHHIDFEITHLAKLIAPSRKDFVHQMQQLESKRLKKSNIEISQSGLPKLKSI